MASEPLNEGASGSAQEGPSGSATEDIVPKFDMHTYTSTMTEEEVRDVARLYGIPEDLHPRVPPEGMTMNKLPADAIGIYEQYLEFSVILVPFSTLLLQIIKYFRVHLSQWLSIGLTKAILFEIYCRSLGFPLSLTLFRLFYTLQKQGHWFSFARRTG
jgi:hypothetical protein